MKIRCDCAYKHLLGRDDNEDSVEVNRPRTVAGVIMTRETPVALMSEKRGVAGKGF